jgi:hypothetical protein
MPHYQHDRRLTIVEHEEEQERLLGDGLSQDSPETHEAHLRRYRRKAKRKVKLVRALALLCACSLSVGSH